MNESSAGARRCLVKEKTNETSPFLEVLKEGEAGVEVAEICDAALRHPSKDAKPCVSPIADSQFIRR